MNRVHRLFTAIGHRFWRPWLRRRLGRLVVETTEGLRLVVLPDVFNPVVFRTGSFLARTLRQAPELEPMEPSARALDLGTGSGVGAIFAARRGYLVTAVDINPRAVRCARINALVHDLEARVEIREGDLFAPVLGETFELVTFNPPFFRGKPRNLLDRAWRGTDVLDRFAAGLPKALSPNGRALLVLSTDGLGVGLLSALENRGFAVEVIAEQRYGNEILTANLATPGL